jgi:hypothetical protein
VPVPPGLALAGGRGRERQLRRGGGGGGGGGGAGKRVPGPQISVTLFFWTKKSKIILNNFFRIGHFCLHTFEIETVSP